MKTYVIQVEEFDDLVSLRDKMAWAKAPRILLIYPHRLRFLPRTLDLILLKRHAASLGAQLAIVTHSPALRERCREADVLAFQTAAAAHRADWGAVSPVVRPRRRRPAVNLRLLRRFLPHQNFSQTPLAVRLLLFGLAVVATLAVFLLFLPSASLELTPAIQEQRLQLTVRADPTAETVNVLGLVPALTLTAEVDGSKIVPVTGEVTIADAFASGEVRFTNLTDAEILLPAGTVVRTVIDPPVRFATVEETTLPAGIGKTVTVPVRALEPGPDGNLPAGSLTAIEADLGAVVAVTNPKPTAGGTQKTVPIQTAQDRQLLSASLQAELLAKCRSALEASLPAGDIFLSQTVTLLGSPLEMYFPAPDQPGEMLALTAHLACTGNYVRQADLRRLAVLALDAARPPDFIPLDDTVEFALHQPFTVSAEGEAVAVLEAWRSIRAKIDLQQAAWLVLNLDPAAASQRLQERFSLAASPVIVVTPSWWPRLPLLPVRVTVLEREE